jgi:hypothetical protein
VSLASASSTTSDRDYYYDLVVFQRDIGHGKFDRVSVVVNSDGSWGAGARGALNYGHSIGGELKGAWSDMIDTL